MTASTALTAQQKIGTAIEQKRAAIGDLLPDNVNVNRFIKSAMMAATRNEDIMKCSRESILTTIVNAAELGLDFTPAKGHAYIVPFKKTATFMPGYRGMIELARRSGVVKKIEAHVVYENDEFGIEHGLRPNLHHKPIIKGTRGGVVGAYAIAWIEGADPQYEWMSKEDIDAIQKKASYNKIWTDHYIEMCRKTAVRRLFKYLPCSPDDNRLEKALEYDNQVAGIADEKKDGRSQTEKLTDLMTASPDDAQFQDVDPETGEVKNDGLFPAGPGEEGTE